MICSACNKKIDRTDATKMTCADCLLIFHLNCTNLNANDLEFMRNNNHDFRCNKCISQRRKSLHNADANHIQAAANSALSATANNGNQQAPEISIVASSSQQQTQQTLAASFITSQSQQQPQQQQPLKPLSQHQQQQVQQQKKQKQPLPAKSGPVTIDMLYAEIISLKSMNKEYLKAINSLQNENTQLHKKYILLESKVRRLEQEKLNCSIDIVGLPNVTNENSREMATKLIHDALSVNLSDEDVASCFVKSTQKKSSSNVNDADSEVGASNVNKVTNNINTIICLEFCSLATKKKVLESKKENYKKLNAELIDANVKNKIYVNNSLTNYYRALFSSLKTFKKERKLKYVWFKDNRFLLRESDCSEIVVVSSFEDLDTLKKSQTSL